MYDNKLKTHCLGFTLVEILAALLLIGLILPAAMKGISIATMLGSDSARKYEALDLAETKLAEILLQQNWNSSNGAGTFEDVYEQYQWTMSVSDWTMAGIKQIDLMVYWQQRNRQRNVTLSTLVYENEQ